MKLQSKSIIITGAAQGIGAVVALGMAAEGAQLVICDLSDPSHLVDKINSIGGKAVGMVADVTDSGGVARMAELANREFGRIDVLVNNAALFGTIKPQRFEEISSAEWDKVMMVNTRGPFECARAVLPFMKQQKSGKIINVASGAVFKGTPWLLHYISSKGAVVAMTKGLARELGEFGISVNAIAPGATVTELQPRNRKATVDSRCFQREEKPDDLVGTFIYLASPASDFMTGQTLIVDGGAVMH